MADWTDEERLALRKLKAQGLSDSECGRRLGRTKYSVNRQVHYLELPPAQPRVKGVRKVQYVRKRTGKVSLPPLGSLRGD